MAILKCALLKATTIAHLLGNKRISSTGRGLGAFEVIQASTHFLMF